MGCFVVDVWVQQGSDVEDRERDRTRRSGPPGSARTPMNAQQLLQEISDYCRQTGLAESTFGRRAVNDGKLASRLRNGGRITTDTLDPGRAIMAPNPAQGRGPPAPI